ncbi:hypothetical protein N0V90_011093 [Kalmusia sp. IMI 367209]|nr:hypothetical protein N0V90_011093 [Kalmusia sp. IMI 367209]
MNLDLAHRGTKQAVLAKDICSQIIALRADIHLLATAGTIAVGRPPLDVNAQTRTPQILGGEGPLLQLDKRMLPMMHRAESLQPLLVDRLRLQLMRDPVSAPRSPYRERDYDRDREYNRDRERERERERDRSPPRHRDAPPTGPRGDRDREFAPPSGPSSSYRNGESSYSRAPPTGPSNRNYPSPAISPPAGPSGSTPQPPSFPRSTNPVLAAPTRPRGGGRGGFGYDAPRDFSGPPPRRGSAHWGGRGGSFHGGPPSGPRGSASGPTPFAPPFRGSSNSTSTTYPRTQRFGDHLAGLPKEIPGGQKAPELIDTSKILKLEEEARKLREQIEAKEAMKRASLKEWDSLGRDADNAALRSELAEQHLRSLNGDSEVGGAAF